MLQEKYEVVRDMFHGFDYMTGLQGTPQERLVAVDGAMNRILELQQKEATRETTEESKKRAHRRFNDAVPALSKAFALASASDYAHQIRDEVGFFQTVRAALAKSTAGGGKTGADRDLAARQIVSRAVVSTEIVDILEAADVEMPDISILSDEFLAEVEGLTPEERAFYDALADNESAVEVMGDAQLRVIAHELLTNLKKNASVDWQHREAARARMRVLVKRVLRKYGYPPDLQDAAVQTVLQQAEGLVTQWAACPRGLTIRQWSSDEQFCADRH